jgi:hypothetical protein
MDVRAIIDKMAALVRKPKLTLRFPHESFRSINTLRAD